MHALRKIGLLILGLLFFISLSPAPAAAEARAINDLIEDSLQFDGMTVTVQGEAIGEALERGDYAWVNINDGSNAIGLWMPLEEAKKIKVFGDYKHIGDTVKAVGTFSRNCTEHGGDVDIHCSQIEITNPGRIVAEQVSGIKIAAAGLLGLLSASGYLYYKKLMD